jgi:uncharacterized membrane protein
MNLRKVLGIVLLTAGTLALIYRGFSYTSEKHTAHIGSLDFSVNEKKRLELPVWAGVVVLVAGAALLVIPSKRR